jgi:hypothetical protein
VLHDRNPNVATASDYHSHAKERSSWWLLTTFCNRNGLIFGPLAEELGRSDTFSNLGDMLASQYC